MRERFELRTEQDVVLARQAVRRMAQDVGFGLVDQTKFVTAASEIARNAVLHGGGGHMEWEVLEAEARRGLRLVFLDEGPGIADMQLAMTDGWTSRDGLGMGLPGARRLVHEFSIESAPGRGTRVELVRWK